MTYLVTERRSSQSKVFPDFMSKSDKSKISFPCLYQGPSFFLCENLFVLKFVTLKFVDSLSLSTGIIHM